MNKDEMIETINQLLDIAELAQMSGLIGELVEQSEKVSDAIAAGKALLDELQEPKPAPKFRVIESGQIDLKALAQRYLDAGWKPRCSHQDCPETGRYKLVENDAFYCLEHFQLHTAGLAEQHTKLQSRYYSGHEQPEEPARFCQWPECDETISPEDDYCPKHARMEAQKLETRTCRNCGEPFTTTNESPWLHCEKHR